jgi:hypothetical protein
MHRFVNISFRKHKNAFKKREQATLWARLHPNVTFALKGCLNTFKRETVKRRRFAKTPHVHPDYFN